jgi:hypothetical protein
VFQSKKLSSPAAEVRLYAAGFFFFCRKNDLSENFSQKNFSQKYLVEIQTSGF